jgi:tetratricopeptide (TPR) repeat protein
MTSPFAKIVPAVLLLGALGVTDAFASPDEGDGLDPRIQQAVERDRTRFVVKQKLEAARSHIRNGEWPEAEKLLLEARDLAPGNTEIRAELRDVQTALGRRAASAGSFQDEVRARAGVRIDEQRTTANRYAERGRVALSNGQYDTAIEAYEQALFIIESSPFNIDWKGLRESAQSGLRRARQAKSDAERQGRQAAVERSLAEMAAEREQELIQEQQRLEQYMGAAIEAFNRDQFDLAEQYANRILEEQPDNTKA